MKNLIFTIALILFLCGNAYTQWTQQTSPVSVDFNTIHFFDANNGWAFGGSNSVKTTNGGTTWIDQSTNYGFKKVSVVDQNTAFAIVGDKFVYATTNGGSTWIQKTTPAWAPQLNTLDGISFVSSTTGYVGGTNGYIFKTTNGGTSWSLVNAGGFYVNDLFFLDENNGWSCRPGGQWTKTTDGGANWTGGTVGSESFSSVFALDVNNAFLAGGNGTVYKTNNGGTNWTLCTTGITNALYDIRAIDNQTIWAADDAGTIIHSTNGGTTWSSQASGVTSIIKSLFFLDANTGWACGSSSTLLKYSNVPKTITVISPNGGENWEYGTTRNITWTSSNVTNIKIEVTTNNGTNWNVVTASTSAATGSYLWSVNYGPSANCKIKISDAADATVNDVSNNTFTVYEKSITLTSPNGGENWRVGTQHNITWTSNFITNVSIYYQTTSGSSWTLVAASVAAATGSYSWTVPNTPSTTCKVQVWGDGDDAFIDESDNTFNIYQSGVTVTSPNGGEDWLVGTNQNITWTSSNVTNVKLEYTTNNGTNWNTIIASVAAIPASYNWVIPNAPSTNCKVRISDAGDATVNDLSDNTFTISQKSINLTSPNGGENWRVGTQHNITWTKSGFTYVKVEYTTDNGTSWIVIDPSVDATLGMSWTVPNTPSANCKVRVSDAGDATVIDLSDNIFTIYQPAVTVTSPNGGENWLVGTNQNITWTSSNVTNVKLEYTTNNGTNWNTIIASVAAIPASYNWVIPNAPSANCKVRISDAGDATVNDLSDNTFTISQKSITLTSPNGGENWRVGTQHNITWTKSGFIYVKVEYTTDNGTSWIVIDPSVDATLGMSWTVPNTPSANCKVRISDAGDATVNDVSDGLFTISTLPVPVIALTSPNGGENWLVGTNQNITWTSSNVNNIKIEYTTNNGTSWNTIIASVVATPASYNWVIPNSPSTNCKVRISDAGNSTINDLSNNVFTITAQPTITMTIGNVTAVVGDTILVPITVSNFNNIGAISLKIQYNSTVLTFSGVENQPTTGNFAVNASNGFITIGWFNTTPLNLGNSKLLDLKFHYNGGISNLNFITTECEIANVHAQTFLVEYYNGSVSQIFKELIVTSPNGGGSWQIGSQQNILWTSSNVNNVKIEYTTNNGSTWISIINSVPAASGTYTWTIPNTPSTTCKVRVSDAADATVNDVSDNLFSIPASTSITVISPNGGENWLAGTVHNITWTSSNVNNIRLYCSTNGGGNWTYIGNTPANTGSFSWTIQSASSSLSPSANCRIKAADDANLSTFDISNSDFTISKLEQTIPNGGENWAAGTSQSIHWLYAYTDFNNVKLEYTTNNGSNWNVIIGSTPISVNSYNWTVPNNPSTQCRVRISNPANPSQKDSSNNVFTISSLTLTSPNGSESWKVGTSQNITWNSSNIANVKLEYSTNSGSTWIIIIASNPSVLGSYSWTVPITPSTNCKVRISDVSNSSYNDLSDNTFTIYQPSIALTSPNGGELWLVGTTKNITWTSSYISNVILDYSKDNGITWTNIISSVPASPSNYQWTLPNINSNMCLVRISDAGNSLISDTSNNVFSISALLVTFPNGGEKLQAGKTKNISWLSTNIGWLNIYYSIDDALNWNSVAFNKPSSSGSFTWNIPNTPSVKCRVKIKNPAGSITDSSDRVFTITSLQVSAPNGGENIKPGADFAITWQSKNIRDVKLEYTSDNGAHWQLIVDKTNSGADGGGFVWQVPSTVSGNCKIKVTDKEDDNITDESDAVFNITLSKFISTVVPTGTERWYIGNTYQIKWYSINIPKVNIEFTSDNGVKWEKIVDNINASDQLFNWKIEVTVEGEYRIRVRDYSDTSVVTVSPKFRIIFVPEIVLSTPNGGEHLEAGNDFTIKWTSRNISRIKIQSRINNYTETIENSYPAELGSYVWTVPIENSTNCKIILTDLYDADFKDMSSNSFSIYVPPLKLTYPNGGENFQIGTECNIKWVGLKDLGKVDLHYSLDNGSTWSLIGTADVKDYIFSWRVPDNLSNNCKVKIVAKNQRNIYDISDGIFAISDYRIMDWYWLETGTNKNLNGVYFVNDQNGFIVGNNGLILSTATGGRNWNVVSSGVTNNLNSIQFINSSVGWIIGAGGKILKTSNSGLNWITQVSGVTSTLLSNSFINEQVGYVCGIGGTILRTTNGGNNWIQQTTGITNNINSIHFFAADIGWAACDNGKILKTTDGGNTWVQENSGVTENIKSVFFVDERNGFAGVNQRVNFLLKTTDGGNVWSAYNNPTVYNFNQLRSMYFTNTTTGWILTDDRLLKTTDGGSTFEQSYFNPTFNSFMMLNPGLIWVVGDGGKLCKYNYFYFKFTAPVAGNKYQYGNVCTITWESSPDFVVQGLTAYKGEQFLTTIGSNENMQNGYFNWNISPGTSTNILGNNIRIQIRTHQPVLHLAFELFSDPFTVSILPSSTTWEQLFGFDKFDHFTDSYFINENLGWVTTYFTKVFKTTNGGFNWTFNRLVPEDYPLGVWWSKTVWFVDENNGFVGGGGSIDNNRSCGRGFYGKTTNGGNSWDADYTATYICGGYNEGYIEDVFFNDALNGWQVGDGILKHTTDGGNNWQNYIYVYDEYYAVHSPEPSTAYAIRYRWDFELDKGFWEIVKTSDYGNTWPGWPDNPIFRYDKRLNSIWFINQNVGWVVGDNGKILKTIDGGKNWVFQNSGTDLPLLKVKFVNSRKGYIVGGYSNYENVGENEKGIILTTNTAGEKWTVQVGNIMRCLNDISIINENTIYVVGDFGTILKTTSGGEFRVDSKATVIDSLLPGSFNLSQNYPNPFNPSTTINYALPNDSRVELRIFNVIGEQVAELVNEVQPAGYYRKQWIAENLSSGIYLLRIDAKAIASEERFVKTMKMIFLK
ncbi:MAG: YCF48-related protein [Ignavibacteriales bacterium]|nr:YCF48-related protein [Ignavibacteriales bacterium]